MRALFANIMLAIVWGALTGDFTPVNLGVGLLVGLVGLWLLGDVVGTHDHGRRTLAACRLLGLFAWEILLANLRVARDVLTPQRRARPAILAVPLDACSDLEILMLTSLVTLTPGTVVVDVDKEADRMFVYLMYTSDLEADRLRIKNVLERGVLRVTREE